MARRVAGASQGAMFVGDKELFEGGLTRLTEQTGFVPFDCPDNFHLVTTEAELQALATAMLEADIVAIDTEFSGAGPTVNPHRDRVRLVGLSVACAGHSYYVPIAHRQTSVVQPALTTVRRLLAPAFVKPMCGHNIKVDRHILAYNGFPPIVIDMDTMNAAAALGYQKRGLKERYGTDLNGTVIEFDTLAERSGQKKSRNPDPALFSIADMLVYAANDSWATLRLAELYKGMIAKTGPLHSLFYRVMMPTDAALMDMEANGLLLDAEHYQKLLDKYIEKANEHWAAVSNHVGQPVKISSPDQLAWLLYEWLKLPCTKFTKSGKRSTDKNVLGKLFKQIVEGDIESWAPAAQPIIKLIQQYSQAEKLCSTYDLRLHVMREQTRRGNTYPSVHGSFWQGRTKTGRLASSGPNQQNIPVRSAEGREVRNGVIAWPDWWLVSADQSQMEPRILAWILSKVFGDDTLLDSYRQGKDIYVTMASLAMGLTYDEIKNSPNLKAIRSAAKILVLALFYGASAEGLVDNSLLDALRPTVEQLQIWLDTLYQNIPALKEYQFNCICWALYQGYVESPWGWRNSVPEARHADSGMRSGALRASMNSPIQGFNANLICAALVRIRKIIVQLGLTDSIEMIAQIHDEVVGRVRDDTLAVARTMLSHMLCTGFDLGVEVKSDVELAVPDKTGFSRWGNVNEKNAYDAVVERDELPPQRPDTDQLIALIKADVSPFLDMPLSNVMRRFDLKFVVDAEFPLYVWYAAALNYPLSDHRLPVRNQDAPKGLMTGVRTYMTKGSERRPSRPFWRGTLAFRGGYLKVISFDAPLADGYVQLFGEFEEQHQNFRVTEAVDFDINIPLETYLKDGQAAIYRGRKVRFDLLRKRIDAAQKQSAPQSRRPAVPCTPVVASATPLRHYSNEIECW